MRVRLQIYVYVYVYVYVCACLCGVHVCVYIVCVHVRSVLDVCPSLMCVVMGVSQATPHNKAALNLLI